MLQLIKFGLATNRIAEILVYEKVFAGLRSWLGIRYYDQGDGLRVWIDAQNPVKKFIAEMLTCTSCTGVWVAIGMILLAKLWATGAETLANIFTVSYIANKIP